MCVILVRSFFAQHNTSTHIHTYTDIHTHAHTHTHTHSNTLTQTNTPTHIHTHARTHTCTHIHNTLPCGNMPYERGSMLRDFLLNQPRMLVYTRRVDMTHLHSIFLHTFRLHFCRKMDRKKEEIELFSHLNIRLKWLGVLCCKIVFGWNSHWLLGFFFLLR